MSAEHRFVKPQFAGKSESVAAPPCWQEAPGAPVRPEGVGDRGRQDRRSQGDGFAANYRAAADKAFKALKVDPLLRFGNATDQRVRARVLIQSEHERL
jgi:hypothetical protein